MKRKPIKPIAGTSPPPAVPAPLPPVAPPTAADNLKAAAQSEGHIPLWKDFAYFLLHNKKWWLLPIILILLALSLLVALSSTAVAPFIYTVF